MREVIPGFINYRYRSDGTLPGHTKSYFTKYDILTIHNVIVTNALVFMHKVRHFPLELPQSVRKTIPENAPVQGSTQDSCYDWLQSVSNHFYMRSVFYKGPLVISIYSFRHFGTFFSIPSLLNAKIHKKDARKPMMKYQSSGNAEEWQSGNFLLYNIPGLEISSRNLWS